MLPFLFLATRPEPEAADEEYALFQRRLGLDAASLERWQLNLTSLPKDLDLDAYSGVVLAGGPFNATTPAVEKSATQRRVERELRDLVTEVVERDIPFFGACFGIGAVGSALGATIDRSVGEPASAAAISVTPEGRADPLLDGVPDEFLALVAHTEGCVAVPDGATLLATSPTAPVQMFRVGKNVYATQFHPETEAEDLLRRMSFYPNAGYFDPRDYESISAHFRSLPLQFAPRLLTNFGRRYARSAALQH